MKELAALPVRYLNEPRLRLDARTKSYKRFVRRSALPFVSFHATAENSFGRG